MYRECRMDEYPKRYLTVNLEARESWESPEQDGRTLWALMPERSCGLGIETKCQETDTNGGGG